jgi:heterodisulfide reductase subunit C
MVFTILLYLSLIIFAGGMVYKVSTWFRRKIGIFGQDASASTRFTAAVKGIIGVLFSAKFFTLIKAFILDVILQVRILKEDFLRWFMHMLIYGGFMLLLLTHALDDYITDRFVSDYYSTLNPFLFLRDLFGLMVILGICIAVFRRFILKVPRLRTHGMDHYAIVILSVIMVSGLFLEGEKISSHTEFQYMVEDYADMEDEEELRFLESYWVQNFGTVSPNVKGPFDQETLDEGLELHETSCAECHSPYTSAFVGFAIAKSIRPVALALDRAGGVTFFYYVHILACFLGLAYLPFSKMFHIFASSASLMANAVMDRETSDPVNIATRQVMELDACTHCGTCSLRCSVAVGFDKLGNSNILPSEKIQVLKSYVAGKLLDEAGLRAIQEGIYLCTNCDRCTLVCPAGICLRDLWLSVREELIQKGLPVPLVLSPFSWYREKPEAAVDLLPHQIMRAMGLGIKDLAMGSKMLWYCLTCYQCQEHCPQGVKVTDILYELKNKAVKEALTASPMHKA